MKNYKEISYNELAKKELEQWKKDILKKPSIFDKASKDIQNKFNGVLPDKYHEIMTSSIKGMTKLYCLDINMRQRHQLEIYL